MSLPTRKIGNDSVTAIGFGLMGMSAFYGPIDSDEERFKVLNVALEAGCTNWDSANIYGDSEELLGRWFKKSGKRNDIFLATKFGFTPSGANNTPEYIKSCCDESLKKLGIETIDLTGKIRNIGLSEVSGATLRRAYAVHPIAAVQIEYSPFCLDMEQDRVGLLSACNELGVTIVAYSPLGRGLLTGKYLTASRVSVQNTTPQRVKFASPGSLRKVKTLSPFRYLKENLHSVEVKLTPEEITEIRKAAEKADELHIERYPLQMMREVFADTIATRKDLDKEGSINSASGLTNGLPMVSYQKSNDDIPNDDRRKNIPTDLTENLVALSIKLPPGDISRIRKLVIAINPTFIGQHDVSAIGFGLMGLSAYYGPIDNDEERFKVCNGSMRHSLLTLSLTDHMKVLDAALEAGCTNWDSSDIYGDSEELLGKWFKRTGKRDQIFLATKFGSTPEGPNGKPEYVRSAIESSLKKLGVDTIDLYYIHRIDQTVPIEVTIRALAELVKEGKIRYLGLSEMSAATLRRAHAVHPISAIQIEYSPFFLDIENEKVGLLETCRELGIAVVAYSPLGRGMLTGAYKSHDDIPDGEWRKTIPKFSRENFPNILKLVAGFQDVGKNHGATAGQVALAWLLAQGDDIIPIPGTKKIKYLKENLGAADVRLSPEEIARIRNLAETVNTAVGGLERYPVGEMVHLLADTPEL
ncbi:hypothetical protein CVT25_007138 [Psilocybe cyanescens]|uniref:NADP-dependent oxidoreductase domain-containing protein n=1 Tax=Psilocybe cyanescens TaxID=93625 RepID=A0A409WVM9_PSICY|nr:hypothetical protein CVT25_007138 [Psilocybe cyanescens]